MYDLTKDATPEILEEIENEAKKRLRADPLYNDLMDVADELEGRIDAELEVLGNIDRDALKHLVELLKRYNDAVLMIGKWRGKMEMVVAEQLAEGEYE